MPALRRLSWKRSIAVATSSGDSATTKASSDSSSAVDATLDEKGSGESFGTTNACVAAGTSGDARLSVIAITGTLRSDAMRTAYFDVLTFIEEQGLEENGPPLSITRVYSGSSLIFDAAIPVRGVTESTPADRGNVKLGSTYAGPAVRVRHQGSYRTLARTHRKIAAYLTAHGLERNGDAWEAYVSDPSLVREEELLTFVYYPVRFD